MSPELEDLFARVIANRMERLGDQVAAEPIDEPPAPTGDKLRAQGEAKALHAKAEWVERAEAVLQEWSQSAKPFTSEDLTAVVGLPYGSSETNRNNAVGALLSKWARQHRIREVGMTRTKNAQGHSRRLVQWAGWAGQRNSNVLEPRD